MEAIDESGASAAVVGELAEKKVKLSRLENELTDAGHEQVLVFGPAKIPQKVKVLQRLPRVGALELADVEHDHPGDVEPLHGRLVAGLLGQQRGLDVSG